LEETYKINPLFNYYATGWILPDFYGLKKIILVIEDLVIFDIFDESVNLK
jgi:hypothetical protein